MSHRDKVDFANPFLKCSKCTRRVKYAVNLHSDGPVRLGPCSHKAAAVSECMSWGPVDGCVCDEFGYVHRLPPGNYMAWSTW